MTSISSYHNFVRSAGRGLSGLSAACRTREIWQLHRNSVRSRRCTSSATRVCSDSATELTDFSAAPEWQLDRFGISIYQNFASDEELAAFHKDVDGPPGLLTRKYQAGHWDGVITGYREYQRPVRSLSPAAQAVCRRVHEVFPPGSGTPMDYVHALDIQPDPIGRIDRHVDSVKFSGNVVAGLCLLSPAVMRLYHEHSDAVVSLYLPVSCLYVMSGEARYNWGHAIVSGTNGDQEDPNRRLTAASQQSVIQGPDGQQVRPDPALPISSPNSAWSRPKLDIHPGKSGREPSAAGSDATVGPGGRDWRPVTWKGEPVVRGRRVSIIFRDELLLQPQGASPSAAPSGTLSRQ